jgi:4-carboxymuconolactone decarboxylase
VSNPVYLDYNATTPVAPEVMDAVLPFLITVSALIALNRPDQLRSHLELTSRNGLTREELAEAITHLAFYSGWPSSVPTATIAKEVLPPKK